MSADLEERLRARLRELGFDAIRFTSVAESSIGDGLRSWLGAGHHADMAWLERTQAKREDPTLVLSGVRSIIMLGINYGQRSTHALSRSEATDGLPPANPIWARYAQHVDYHDSIRSGLEAAGRAIEELFGVSASDYRYYVDTGPVLERFWAERSGLGFVGKNAMLISREFGNWLFLAAILTRLELTPDRPIRKKFGFESREGREARVGLLCGKCARCLDACPTQAFTAPGVLDSRRCISYQTIENKGVIPRELRAGIGLRIYGCDVCLEVCPWNRFAQESRRILLTTRDDLRELSLGELLALTPERFAAVFKGTAIKRLKLTGLLRNACIVAGNAGDARLLPAVVALAAGHASPLVRAHAVWAAHRLGGGDHLAAARATENAPIVLAEYAAEPS